MKKHLLVLLFLLGYCFCAVAQKNDNNHNYIIVPLQYDFLKGKDKYRLNTQTRYFLKQDGFKVYFDQGEQMPEELFNNRCLAMYANVEKLSSFLKTKLKITLKDCYGNIVLESREGASKIKDYNLAYKEALEKAYVTLDFSKLKQIPVLKPQNYNEDNKILRDDHIEAKYNSEKLDTLVKNTEKNAKATNIITNNTSEDKQLKTITADFKIDTETIYYAQKISGGFQVVDSEPKVVMVLLQTGSPELFLVKDQNAMLVKKNDKWFYSENRDGQLKERLINIKF